MTGIVLILYHCIDFIAGHYADDRWYFILQQISFVLLIYCVFILARKYWHKALAAGTLLASIFELVDEFMGNNTAPFINDYVCLAISLLTTLLYYKWLKSKKN